MPGYSKNLRLTTVYTSETVGTAIVDAKPGRATLGAGIHKSAVPVADSTTIGDEDCAVATGTNRHRGAADPTAVGATGFIAFRTFALAAIRVVGLVGRTGVGDAYSDAGTKRGTTRATATLAHPGHALLPLRAAVQAAATVPLVRLQVDAPAFAAGLGRTATVGAAAAVALVRLQVDAAVPAASLSFGASVVVGPGHPRDGGQGGTYEGAAHPPKGLAPRDGACCKPLGKLVEGAVGSLLAHPCPIPQKAGH
jgi:hypothetical protein